MEAMVFWLLSNFFFPIQYIADVRNVNVKTKAEMMII
jgi:hypothetical protein